MSFVSTTTLKAKAEAKKKALEQELQAARGQFIAQQKKEKIRKETKQDTWINPSLNKRLAYKTDKDVDYTEFSRSKSKSTKGKKKSKNRGETEDRSEKRTHSSSSSSSSSNNKKSKKDKKRSNSSKKDHKKRNSSKKSKSKRSSSSSESGSDSEWEEASNNTSENLTNENENVASQPIVEVEEKPKMERQSWMMTGLPFTSNRVSEQKSREAKKPDSEEDMFGKHPKEINPYWKAKQAEEAAKKELAEDVNEENQKDKDSAPPEAPKRGTMSWRNRVLQRLEMAKKEHPATLNISSSNSLRASGAQMSVPSNDAVLNTFTTTQSQKKSDVSMSQETSEVPESESDSSSSSSSSSSEEEVPVPAVDLNKLNAKLLKCELMGDDEEAELIRKEIDMAKKQQQQQQERLTAKKNKQKRPHRSRKERSEEGREGDGTSKSLRTEEDDDIDNDKQENIVFSAPNNRGVQMPLYEKEDNDEFDRRGKLKKVESHDKANRSRYYADDDKLKLEDLVKRERLGDDHDYDGELLSNYQNVNNDSYDSDIFIPKQKSAQKKLESEQQRAINADKKTNSILSKCRFCVDSPEFKQHLLVSLGMELYLAVPENHSLVSGHCFIVPMQHVSAMRDLDESVLHEIMIFKKYLTKMMHSLNCTPIFIETAMNLRRQYHSVIECIPIPNDSEGAMASIYFKKALNDMGSEWAQHKKLVETKAGSTIRDAIPAGFPYFHVEFGTTGGFARVIDNESKFPHYFGKEIVGGILDLEPRSYRRPLFETLESGKKKTLKFTELWKPFDWTATLET